MIACLALGLPVCALAQAPTPPAAVLKPCRLAGVEHDALCGSISRALDPAQPGGVHIDVHFAVLPALARRKLPDPVFFFAGGPGQSGIDLAGAMSRQFSRFANRRDVVLIDQRGTGLSAPLTCGDDKPTRSLAEQADMARQIARLLACRDTLEKKPYGNLKAYTTTIAMADVEAIRLALGAGPVNIVGGSYGTRAALEYMRQFPHSVRRAVIDGVAPPDMVLPLSFSTDNQAAFDALLGWCEADAACLTRYPGLRAKWQALLAGLPKEVTVAHPVTGQRETVRVDRDAVLGLVRLPLYAPSMAAALPLAVSDASQGRFDALVGLGSAVASGATHGIAEGMHFSVVCAEDVPRMDPAFGSVDKAGADFGDSFGNLYRQVCAGWPRGEVPAAFYTLPSAPVPTLVLSGAIDPATPPRHGERVARALGAKARHVVVPNAGHIVMSLPCLRDALFRFIDAPADDEAMKVDVSCAGGVPRPPAFVPPKAQP